MTDIALRYLHEAAGAGSMRVAADRIGVAVSSISRQIAQLEAELGISLIERGTRTIRLTAAGVLAVEYYQGQVAEHEGFLTRLSDLRGVRSGEVELAIGEGFLGQSFTALLDEFQRASPLIRTAVHVGTTREVVRKILADEAHLGLVFHMPVEPKMRIRSSARQPLKVLVAPHHPLARRRAASLADLQDHPLCLGPKEFRIRQIVGAAEARRRLFLTPAMTTNSVMIMREAAISGRFATILPEIAAVSEIETGRLVGVPLVDEGIEDTTIALVSRAGRRLEGAPLKMLTMLEARLRTWIREEVSDEGAGDASVDDGDGLDLDQEVG